MSAHLVILKRLVKLGQMSNVALIPARKGSQRIPLKNIRELCGKPLIAWTIEAAIHSRRFSSIVVSTDSPEIENVSREWGAEVVIRPERISRNTSHSRDVVLHFLERHKRVENVAFLQPTSPLRTAHHISEAVDLWLKSDGQSVASCYPLGSGYSWTLSSDKSRDLTRGPRNQEMAHANKSIAVVNGAIYIFDAENFLSSPVFVSRGTIPYFMNKWDSIDIDVREDWNIAEHLLAERISVQ
jgi:CMP-N,N'-diacetyllegionaminic acid synthase